MGLTSILLLIFHWLIGFNKQAAIYHIKKATINMAVFLFLYTSFMNIKENLKALA
jgi:hypothetical protein